MNLSYFIIALAIISVLSNVTVSAIKQVFIRKDSDNFSSTRMNVITCIILSFCYTEGSVLFGKTTWSVQTIVIMVVLMYLSFLVGSIGYDKVKEMLNQINAIKTEEIVREDVDRSDAADETITAVNEVKEDTNVDEADKQSEV